MVYAGNYASGDVTVIDGRTRRALATVRAGEHPQALAVDDVRNLVFSANTHGNSVTVIDGATNRALATLPAGRRPYALAVQPGSSKLYVANAAGEKVFRVVDTSGIPGAR
jgi:YVTN family beta-propeller protein